MNKVLRKLTLVALVGGISAFLACTPVAPVPPAHFSVVSISGAHVAKGISPSRAFAESLPIAVGDMDAGPPDYFVLTLKKIVLEGDFGVQPIWEEPDGVDIAVSGTGSVDLTGVADIGDLPVGHVTGVKITLATRATIKGSLAGTFIQHPITGLTFNTVVHTRAAHSYNAHTFLMEGGTAATIADYETDSSPEGAVAEETSVWWNGPDNNGEADHEFLFPADEDLVSGDSRAFTILVDVSRALRFYDGLGGGTAPAETNAYFFSHTVLTGSIACYFGDAGLIQGYSTLFQSPADSATTQVAGWMSLVFDSSGNIQSGILVGDDDGSVINKGHIASSTVTGATFSLAVDNGLPPDYYEIAIADIVKATVLQGTADAAFVKTQHSGSSGDVVTNGDARFTLELELH